MDIEKIGVKIGYFLMFFVFATVFYFLLKILDKLPDSWNYLHIVFLSVSIVLFGTLIKLLFK